MNNYYIFITGATGFLGSNLVKRLLEDRDNYIFALIRTNLSEKALQKKHMHYVRTISCSITKKQAERIKLVKGDITLDKLGLSTRTLNMMKKKVNLIYHCAALRDFNCPLETIRRVNVTGTRNVLALAMDWYMNGALANVSHISTAYIVGNYRKIFYEEQLDVSQKFKNTYEQSKYEAELAANEFRKKGLWVDVFRPSAISDSMKVDNEKISMMCRLLDLFIYGKLSGVPGKPDARINFIPVDVAADLIYRISVYPYKKRNQNYHIINRESNKWGELIDTVSRTYGLPELKIVRKNSLHRHHITLLEKRFSDFLYPYLQYKSVFDMRNVDYYARKFGIKIPRTTKGNLEHVLKMYLKRGFIKINKGR